MSTTPTASGGSGGLREAMSCDVCSDVYEQVRRTPLVLPCGHTFCRVCLTDIKKSGRFLCPTCRAGHNNLQVEALSVNYSLLNILPLCNQFECDKCDIHGDDLRYWCVKCDLPLCSICLYSGHPQGHNVKLAQTLVKEKKQTLARKTEVIFKKLDEQKKELKECLNELDVRMKQLLYKNAELQNTELELNSLLADIQTANNITSVLNFEKKVREFQSEEENLSDAKTNDQDSDESELKEKSDSKETGEAEGELEGTAAAAAAVNVRDEQASQQQQQQQQQHHESQEDSMEEEQDSDTPRAVMDYRDGRVLLHTMLEPSTSKLSLQMPSQVFLELGVGDRCLGRVYISLWCHLRQAQQFLALCTGIMGPSLLGTKVSEKVRNTIVFRSALDKNNQSFTQALLTGLEWGGVHSKREAEGLVTGMAGNNGLAFGICTQGQTNAAMQAPFGMVVGGLQAANEALQHNPITDVTIIHCGIVLPGLAQWLPKERLLRETEYGHAVRLPEVNPTPRDVCERQKSVWTQSRGTLRIGPFVRRNPVSCGLRGMRPVVTLSPKFARLRMDAHRLNRMAEMRRRARMVRHDDGKEQERNTEGKEDFPSDTL